MSIRAKMKVYIAGPMSGLPDDNRQAFHDMATRLGQTQLSPVVLNPATLPAGLTQAEYMALCLPMVMMADAVVMLEGWERSKGAIAERALAQKLGKPISYRADPTGLMADNIDKEAVCTTN